MSLTPEEVKNIKDQLFKQIEGFPDEQKETARKQIEAMTPEEVEAFLEKNKMMAQEQGEEGAGKDQPSCIFCSIIDGSTTSYKIEENKAAIAVLDINPVSKGHSMIIPKKHSTIEKLPSAVLGLAKKVAKRLKSKLKAEEVRIETNTVQGHAIISVIPMYKDKKLEKKKADEAELQELYKKLVKKPRAPRPAKPKQVKELPQAPVRIP